MNGERVYFSDQHLNPEQPNLIEGTNTHFQHTFKNFLDSFTRENVRAYHKQIVYQTQKSKYVLLIELSDIKSYEEHLF